MGSVGMSQQLGPGDIEKIEGTLRGIVNIALSLSLLGLYFIGKHPFYAALIAGLTWFLKAKFYI